MKIFGAPLRSTADVSTEDKSRWAPERNGIMRLRSKRRHNKGTRIGELSNRMVRKEWTRTHKLHKTSKMFIPSLQPRGQINRATPRSGPTLPSSSIFPNDLPVDPIKSTKFPTTPVRRQQSPVCERESVACKDRADMPAMIHSALPSQSIGWPDEPATKPNSAPSLYPRFEGPDSQFMGSSD